MYPNTFFIEYFNVYMPRLAKFKTNKDENVQRFALSALRTLESVCVCEREREERDRERERDRKRESLVSLVNFGPFGKFW